MKTNLGTWVWYNQQIQRISSWEMNLSNHLASIVGCVHWLSWWLLAGCGLGRAENLVAVDKEEALMKNMLPTRGLLSRKTITLSLPSGGLSGLAIEWLLRRWAAAQMRDASNYHATSCQRTHLNVASLAIVASDCLDYTALLFDCCKMVEIGVVKCCNVSQYITTTTYNNGMVHQRHQGPWELFLKF